MTAATLTRDIEAGSESPNALDLDHNLIAIGQEPLWAHRDADPDGVPVKMRSPGSRVTKRDT